MKVVDFLPAMYMFEQFLATRKPKEITSYDRIIIPFDKYIWLFTFGCICAQFLLLVAMQYLYSHVTGTIIPNDFIYEGKLYYQTHLTHVYDEVLKFQTFSSLLN